MYCEEVVQYITFMLLQFVWKKPDKDKEEKHISASVKRALILFASVNYHMTLLLLKLTCSKFRNDMPH